MENPFGHGVSSLKVMAQGFDPQTLVPFFCRRFSDELELLGVVSIQRTFLIRTVAECLDEGILMLCSG